MIETEPDEMPWPEDTHLRRHARIGGMATMPSRAHTFKTAFESVLHQVDRLYVFFDKHDAAPDFIRRHPNVVPLMPSEFGALGADGKFLGAQLHGEPCLYFTFDDDIFYPPGYVEHLASALERHHFAAVMGFHALRFEPPHLSYRQDRSVLHFVEPLIADSPADELGSGTMGFFTGRFNVDIRGWPHHTMCDLLFAIEAARKGVPRLAVRRPAHFLRPLEELQADSLFTALKKDDTAETALMRSALAEMPGSWCAARRNAAAKA
jgi:hypothetical protein